MSILVWGVYKNECNSARGFRQSFSFSSEADVFIQTRCAAIDAKHIHDYALYLTQEFVSLDEVLHHHNWLNTDERFKDINNKITTIDIAKIKEYTDLEYARHKQRQATHRAERVNEIRNMDAAAIEYHRQLFQQMNINLL